MINFAECLRYYAKYIRWHYTFIDKDFCNWYQEKCRYYKD